MADNVLMMKSKAFAIRVVNLYKHLCSSQTEYIMSKQLLRSGTSIGANISEANYAQSKKDFIAKMQIALKETAETEYWLGLLHETDYMDKKEYESIAADCSDIIRMLVSTLKIAKNNQ
jgi:four helix bundle protein